MGKEINIGLLAYFTGVTWTVAAAMALPTGIFMDLVALPYRVRIGVSVIYSVVSLLLMYFVIRSIRQAKKEVE